MSEPTKIFNTQSQKQLAWTAQGCVMTWGESEFSTRNQTVGKEESYGTGALIPIMMQRLTISYRRGSQPMYPLNQTKENFARCIIMGQAQGSLSVEGIYSPVMQDIEAFLKAVGDPCHDKQVWMCLHPYLINGCDKWNPEGLTGLTGWSDTKFYLGGVMMSDIGIGLQGGDTAYSQIPMNFTFSTLDISVSGGAPKVGDEDDAAAASRLV